MSNLNEQNSSNSSFWQHYEEWKNGDYAPLDSYLCNRNPDQVVFEDEGLHYVHLHLRKKRLTNKIEYTNNVKKRIRIFSRIYAVLAVLLGIFLISLLLWTVSYLPKFGAADAPENNEVIERYIENGLDETGAVNIVAGMILDYRAFDTFGESCVLFIASCCVLFMLKINPEDKKDIPDTVSDRFFEPKNDTILMYTSKILVPLILLLGIYVVLNGHLSPGGGFSGGAIIGAGLILYQTSYGFAAASRFINEKVIKALTFSALTFYCVAKSYSFYTGANGLHSFIGTGTPGAILSAGLILYLNICVGIVVACTMYSFYSLFRKGGL